MKPNPLSVMRLMVPSDICVYFILFVFDSCAVFKLPDIVIRLSYESEPLFMLLIPLLSKQRSPSIYFRSVFASCGMLNYPREFA